MKEKILLVCLVCSSLLFCSQEKKIALLFLTRADLNHTELWKKWIDPTLYTVYNHSKNLVSDPWFAQYEIPEKKPNEWGYLLLSQQALLKEALKNPLNFKFVFLSESCVPLKSNFAIYEILTSESKSHMYWTPPWWMDRSRDLLEFPEQSRLGNHQWIILNRKHAQLIVDDDFWIHVAMKHEACDEAYPATFFSMRDVLHEFKKELTTYVDWERGSPYLFSNNVEENFNHLINIKCHHLDPVGSYGYLFARKFSKDFPSDVIQSLIELKD